MRYIFSIAIVLGLALAGPLALGAEVTHTFRVKMTANNDGSLAELYLDGVRIGQPKDKKFTRFDVLHSRIREFVQKSMGRLKAENIEVEVECGRLLKYKHTIEAISAVSGYRDGNNFVRLVEKIKFVPPKSKRVGEAVDDLTEHQQ